METVYAIKGEKVDVYQENNLVLKSTTFSFTRGSLNYIIGGNGVGKSSFIKAILGLTSYKGDITIFGKKNSTKVVSTFCGYLPQYQNLDKSFPITVQELIELECRNNKTKCSVDIAQHLKAFDAEQLLDRSLKELSGGEFQKVLIVRALTSNPDILIFDEPTNNLDLKTSQNFHKKVLQLKNEGKTILIVTHDLTLVSEHMDQVILIADKQLIFNPTTL